MEDGFARKKGPIKAYLEGRHTCSFVSRHFVTRMDAGWPGNTTLKVETNFFSPPSNVFSSRWADTVVRGTGWNGKWKCSACVRILSREGRK